MVLEESTHRAAESMAKLLDILCKACIVSADQLKLGAKRVFDNMGDIVLGNYFKIQSRGLCEELSSSHSVSFACMTIAVQRYVRNKLLHRTATMMWVMMKMMTMRTVIIRSV